MRSTRISYTDNGRHIQLRLREKLAVALPESQISGYMWNYEGKCPCLREDDSDYAERGPARFTGLGERSWHFTACSTGECIVRFSLVRPWSRPSQEFSVVVRVS